MRIASTIVLAASPSPSRPLPHIRAQMQTTPRELSRRDLLQVGPEPAVLGVERVERLVSEAFALQTPGRHGHAAVAGRRRTRAPPAHDVAETLSLHLGEGSKRLVLLIGKPYDSRRSRPPASRWSTLRYVLQQQRWRRMPRWRRMHTPSNGREEVKRCPARRSASRRAGPYGTAAPRKPRSTRCRNRRQIGRASCRERV